MMLVYWYKTWKFNSLAPGGSNGCILKWEMGNFQTHVKDWYLEYPPPPKKKKKKKKKKKTNSVLINFYTGTLHHLFGVLENSHSALTKKVLRALLYNSLWSSDAIWHHRSGSTLAQAMACCLTSPRHSVPEPMLICHQRCSVAFIREQFHEKCSWT